MTTHSPAAQVEVEDEIAKLKTKIEVIEALRQQGNEKRTRPFIYGSFISNRVVLLTIISCHPILFKYSAHINENNTIYCFV
jgi:hypothetical protein